MKIALISQNYVHPTNLYGNVFVHVRVKAYLRHFSEVVVFSAFNRGRPEPEYEHEGVRVVCPETLEEGRLKIEEFAPDVLLVHFATRPVIREILDKLNPTLPCLIWVHGFEALAWYRRLGFYPELNSFKKLLRYVRDNILQLLSFRGLIARSNRAKAVQFVFVSRWMQRITETDCFIKVKHAHVIPNWVDDEVFQARDKDPELRKRFLLIRPFFSKKYATDLFTDALIELSKAPEFQDLRFSVFGEGSRQSRLFKLFGDCPNVEIQDRFLTQSEIVACHKEHGVFIGLTRQDAQGVSMCEAMSSGLVVIASHNTAIPEFVKDGESGLLTQNRPAEIAQTILRIVREAELFSHVSRVAPQEIRLKAGYHVTIQQEINLIRATQARYNPLRSSMEAHPRVMIPDSSSE